MTEESREATARSPLAKIVGAAWVGPLGAVILVYALFAILSPETFVGWINFTTMARQTVVVGIAALGMTLIMVQGGIDLSVGSVVALTTVVVSAVSSVT